MDKILNRNNAVFILFASLLYLTHLSNYLLFHSLAELFSVIIAGNIFVIGWHSRKYINNRYLAFIAIPYLFIGFLDILHTLSYPGMNIFTEYSYHANQLWIATRYMESITLFIAFYVLNSKMYIDYTKVFISYFIITTVIVTTIFIYKVFPICFIEGSGQTEFKIYSEYLISLILIAALIQLYRKKHRFENWVYKNLFASICFTIISELAFTFYIHNYGISNLVGHYFKLFSFYLIYRTIVATGISSPQKLIFKELSETKSALEVSNGTKEKLISLIAHDLRGPMSALVTLFEEYKFSREDYDEHDLERFIDMAYNSVSSTYIMTESTLEWVRIQREDIKPKRERVQLQKLVDMATTPFKLMAEYKNVTLNTNIGEVVSILTDVELTKAVIRNIVNNSIKFSKPGGKIEISAYPKGSSVVIKIEDNGVGICSGLLSKIFSIDYSDIANIRNSGSGLGLSICKEFMEIQGNSIAIDSKEGEGTVVTLTFNDINNKE